VASRVSAGTPYPILVGGVAAEFVDQQDAIGSNLPLAIFLLVGLTFVVLLLMTGSILSGALRNASKWRRFASRSDLGAAFSRFLLPGLFSPAIGARRAVSELHCSAAVARMWLQIKPELLGGLDIA